jgi:hypothetical protein
MIEDGDAASLTALRVEPLHKRLVKGAEKTLQINRDIVEICFAQLRGLMDG